MKIVKTLLIIIVILGVIAAGLWFFWLKDKDVNEIEQQNEENVIEDTEAPVITGVRDRYVVINQDIDLADGISATDNIDGKVEINIEGEIDNTIVGDALITVTAEDKSGNIAKESFRVYVREKDPAEEEREVEERQLLESINM